MRKGRKKIQDNITMLFCSVINDPSKLGEPSRSRPAWLRTMVQIPAFGHKDV